MCSVVANIVLARCACRDASVAYSAQSMAVFSGAEANCVVQKLEGVFTI